MNFKKNGQEDRRLIARWKEEVLGSLGVRGMSLFEILVVVVVGSLLVVLLAKTLKGVSKMMVLSRERTKAAALAEEISSRLKAIPFHHVFSIDSRYQRDTDLNYGVINTPPQSKLPFNPDDYKIPWAVSASSTTFIKLWNDVKSAGFEHYGIQVTYIRRDSSNQNANESWEDYVPWKDTADDAELCDDVDPRLCFRDLDADGRAYSVVNFNGVETPEVPHTGMKLITTYIIHKDATVAVKHGNILTLAGLSGDEVPTEQSPLKFNVGLPKKNIYCFQATPQNVPYLTLQTERGYPLSYFGENRTAIRLDNISGSVWINKDRSNSYNGQEMLGAPSSYVKFKAEVEPGQVGEVFFYDRKIGVDLAPNGDQYHEVDSGSLSGTVLTFDGILDILSDGNHLMREGKHELWSRFVNPSLASQLKLYSPYDRRILIVDTKPPTCTSKIPTPTGVIFSGLGLQPYIRFGVRDPDYATGIRDGIAALHISDPYTTGPTTVTWVGKGGNYNLVALSYTGDPNRYYRLLDKDNYPSYMPIGNYQLKAEFGDNAGYKSSHTWTFSIPATVVSDTTSDPVIKVMTSGYPTNFKNYIPIQEPTAGTYTATVKRGQTYNLLPISFEDVENGIDLKTVMVEECSDNVSAINYPSGDDVNCTPFFWHARPSGAVKPTTKLFGDHWMIYRTVLDYSPRLNTNVIRKFNTLGTRYLRIMAKNWAGQTTPPLEIQVTVTN